MDRWNKNKKLVESIVSFINSLRYKGMTEPTEFYLRTPENTIIHPISRDDFNTLLNIVRGGICWKGKSFVINRDNDVWTLIIL